MILALSAVAHVAIQAGLIIRVLLRANRDAASRIAWIVVILSVPLVGIAVYMLFGETNVGSRHVERMREVLRDLRRDGSVHKDGSADSPAVIPDRWLPLFHAGRSVNRFDPVGGNRAELMADSVSSVEHMVADIDQARDHVHLLFYIWLPDNNGRKMAEALKRAAARGVTCRAMVDDLGSRELLRSPLWQEMATAGVKLGRALPIGNPFLRILFGRIDLRNHRKILNIDNRITYCGSQNCADPEFLPKAKYAPWVDVVLRVEGPVVRQNQIIFAADWMAFVDEDIKHILEMPTEAHEGGFPAQIVATGPTGRFSAMPQMFESLIFAARDSIVITTPYYAPSPGLQDALCAAANRGLDVTMIMPRRNDDLAVAGASRSYYPQLLQSGVNIHEYEKGLLHAKTITIDGEITFVGSANMDRRSFDLNYENNMLIWDQGVTAALRVRQNQFLADSRPVTRQEVEGWPWYRRLVNNTLAIVSPLL
ncbi:MAG: cardiolipin synthase [Salaquimonas sp.]|nr:cardiolipin synthase [Salaquimonas sp.]